MTKKNYSNYAWVEDLRKEELVRRVLEGQKIIHAAFDLQINYGNAKSIIRKVRLRSSLRPKTISRAPKRPRLRKIFRVEKCTSSS